MEQWLKVVAREGLPELEMEAELSFRCLTAFLETVLPFKRYWLFSLLRQS